MGKSIFDEIQLGAISSLTNAIPGTLSKLKDDGKEIKAIYEDIMEGIKKAKSDEDKVRLVSALVILLLQARSIGVKDIFDPFKGVRLKADEVARAFNFEKYKKLRNLK